MQPAHPTPQYDFCGVTVILQWTASVSLPVVDTRQDHVMTVREPFLWVSFPLKLDRVQGAGLKKAYSKVPNEKKNRQRFPPPAIADSGIEYMYT